MAVFWGVGVGGRGWVGGMTMADLGGFLGGRMWVNKGANGFTKDGE